MRDNAKSIFYFTLALIMAMPSVIVAGTTTIPLDPGIVNGFGNDDIVVNPVTNRIYSTNENSDSVSVVDGSTDTFIKNIAVGSAPSSIDANTVTNKLYVANEDDGTVTVIDGATNTVVATINVGTSPSSLMVLEATNRIYVANAGDGTVSVIKGDLNIVEKTIVVGSGGYKINIGINRTTKLVYVANMNWPGDVYVIDGDPANTLSFNTVITTISPGFGSWGVLYVKVNEATN